jgi:hypothetical protein
MQHLKLSQFDGALIAADRDGTVEQPQLQFRGQIVEAALEGDTAGFPPCELGPSRVGCGFERGISALHPARKLRQARGIKSLGSKGRHQRAQARTGEARIAVRRILGE